jgi:AcrR family transcriptional regulator
VARTIPADRLEQLVRVATEVFIEQGYRRTQMADVADALGVAKGTLYLYVEGKEALFDMACRAADRPFEPPVRLPVPNPPARATSRYIAERITSQMPLRQLGKIGSSRSAGPVRTEVAAVVGEIYDVLAANRTGLKLVDRSARDLPELAELWYGGARGAVLTGLERYLRSRSRQLRPIDDVGVAARFVVETCAFWAVHRHWDAAPVTASETTARAMVIDLVTSALVASRPSERKRRAPS